jgi:hypothetical protein
MNVFAKIFAQIFDSTIAKDYVVRHVFMDMLVLADRDGVVDMTVDAIARRTNVPQELVDHAIKELMNPDLKSRSKAESGARITPIDSGRDWGWQIVNYEHYRNIRDEEARRTYFRDKKREQREREGQTPSNDVKDSQTISTQGEEEGDLKSPSVPPRIRSTGGDGEFMAANWLMEEAGFAGTPGDVRIVAQVIAAEAKVAGCDAKGAAEFLLGACQRAQERGELVNVFWLKDRKYTLEGQNGRTGKSKPSPAKERIDGARRVLAKIAIERGLVDPTGDHGGPDAPVPGSRPR